MPIVRVLYTLFLLTITVSQSLASGDANKFPAFIKKSGLNYSNCIWMPNKVTKCKIGDLMEERISSYKNITICKKEPEQRFEKSKWTWLYPSKKDLFIFGELIGCVNKTEVDKMLIASGFKEVIVNNIKMEHKEQTIRNLFNHTKKECEFTAIQCREGAEALDGPKGAWTKPDGDKGNQGNLVWCSSFWRCKKGNKYDKGSSEIRINCTTKKYQIMDDYWDIEGHGWTIPGPGFWHDINENKSFSGHPSTLPIIEIMKGFCPF